MTIITFCKLSSKEIFLFLHIFVRRSLQERVHSEMKTCARLYYCQHIQPTVLIFQSALIVQLVLKAEHCIRFEIGRACVLFISEWISTLRRLAGGLKHWSIFVFPIRGWVVELGKYTYIIFEHLLNIDNLIPHDHNLPTISYYCDHFLINWCWDTTGLG